MKILIILTVVLATTNATFRKRKPFKNGLLGGAFDLADAFTGFVRYAPSFLDVSSKLLGGGFGGHHHKHKHHGYAHDYHYDDYDYGHDHYGGGGHKHKHHHHGFKGKPAIAGHYPIAPYYPDHGHDHHHIGPTIFDSYPGFGFDHQLHSNTIGGNFGHVFGTADHGLYDGLFDDHHGFHTDGLDHYF